MRELSTSRSQACWQEWIHKEAVARVAWHIRYGHKYLEGTRPREQPRQAPFRSAAVVRPGLATGSPVSKGVQVRRPEPRGAQTQVSRAVGAQGPPPKAVRVREAGGATQSPAGRSGPEGLDMRQAPPNTLKLLFQGISHDGQGRALYLQERHRQTPQEKFRYPIVSSWEYGWHVGDAMKDSRVPTYARIQPITKSFYLKSGIFHFPRRTDQLM